MKPLIVCLIGGLIVTACKPAAEKSAKGESAEPAERAAMETSRSAEAAGVVKFSPEAIQRAGVKIAPVAAGSRFPEARAFGMVVDPAPLIAAHGEIQAAEASVSSLRTIAQRTKHLFDLGETVSRKAMESAQADLEAAEIKARTLQRQAQIEWGPIARLQPSEVDALVADLAGEKVVLVRVDLPAGDWVTALPVASRIQAVGQSQWTAAKVIGQASKLDPKIQGQEFLLRVDDPGMNLKPGAAVAAYLQKDKSELHGVIVPDSAVLRVDGKTWVEIAGDNAFKRTEVSLEFPVEGGWFTTNGLKAGDKIVVEGAQVLLSEEQKSRISED